MSARCPHAAPGTHCRRQRGTVLALTLVYVLLLALLAGSLLQAGSLEMHMAVNAHEQQAALLRADSVAGAVSATRDHFDMAAPFGQRICNTRSAAADCDLRTLPAPGAVTLLPGETLQLAVERRPPALLTAPGGDEYALFEVDVRLADGPRGAGDARAVRGIAVPVAGGAPIEVYWREPGFDPL